MRKICWMLVTFLLAVFGASLLPYPPAQTYIIVPLMVLVVATITTGVTVGGICILVTLLAVQIFHGWSLVTLTAYLCCSIAIIAAAYLQGRVTEELKANEIRFRTLADLVPQIVWETNAKGETTYINTAWYDTIGETHQVTDWGKYVHPDDLQELRRNWADFVQSKKRLFSLVYRVKTKAHGYRWYLGRGVAIFDKGRITRYVGVGTDIQEFKQSTIDLTRTVEQRDRFVASLSHELKNPLTTITMSLNLLLKQQPEFNENKLFKNVQTACATMLELLSDVLEASKTSEGFCLRLSQCQPEEIIARGIESFMIEAQTRGIQLKTELGANLRNINCDRTRMSQALLNLLSNAMKYTQRGGTVVLGLKQTDGEALFYVRDTGRGMTPDEVRNLFTRYWRADETKTPGTGLGLVIVKNIVEAHHGRIWVESELGKGSTFYVSIPSSNRA